MLFELCIDSAVQHMPRNMQNKARCLTKDVNVLLFSSVLAPNEKASVFLVHRDALFQKLRNKVKIYFFVLSFHCQRKNNYLRYGTRAIRT